MPTIEQLQAEIDHLEDELLSQGKKLNEKMELLRKTIPKSEHERIIAKLKTEHGHEIEKLVSEYEGKLSIINNRHMPKHNERNAGRKKIVTDEICSRASKMYFFIKQNVILGLKNMRVKPNLAGLSRIIMYFLWVSIWHLILNVMQIYVFIECASPYA